MDTSTFPNDTVASTAGAASEMARHLGSSTMHVLGATKEAGKQVGALAKEEMGTLRAELDSLTSRIASMSDFELAAAKEKLLARIESTKVATKSLARDVTERVSHGVDVTTGYVKERPLQTLAVAASLGIVLGMMISRR